MRNFCNLIGLERWYFEKPTYENYKTFAGSSINKWWHELYVIFGTNTTHNIQNSLKFHQPKSSWNYIKTILFWNITRGNTICITYSVRILIFGKILCQIKIFGTHSGFKWLERCHLDFKCSEEWQTEFKYLEGWFLEFKCLEGWHKYLKCKCLKGFHSQF